MGKKNQHHPSAQREEQQHLGGTGRPTEPKGQGKGNGGSEAVGSHGTRVSARGTYQIALRSCCRAWDAKLGSFPAEPGIPQIRDGTGISTPPAPQTQMHMRPPTPWPPIKNLHSVASQPRMREL